MRTYKRHRYPSQIISHTIWLYHRFTPTYANSLRKKQGQLGDQWFVDEVFIKINGKQHYLWRAVDQDNSELDILVTKKRDKKSALKFFKKLFKSHGVAANRIVTDKLRSYPAALIEVGCEVPHDTARYHNNIAEISHLPITLYNYNIR